MEKIKEFVNVSSGYGDDYGYGDSDDYGSGNGNGYGSGNGSGDGYGSGYGDGYGNGYGYGDASGDGSGSGYGYGSGYGSGDGSGDGYGHGYGDDDGIKEFNGMDVYIIDGIQTILTNVHANIAKGFILNDDLTLKPCYIAKGNGMFAHGETAREANTALQEKIFETMDPVEKIDAFIKETDLKTKYPAMFFYEWHHKLTGSCEMGRKQFAASCDVNLETDEFTVAEFIGLTKNAYGGQIIKQLEERLEEMKEGHR